MSTFPSSSQAGAYEARLAVTSNPFMAEGQSQQSSAAGAAASLHPSQVLYAQNSLAEAALYETLTPLPSPPLSMLGQPQDDIAASGQAELTRYRANDAFTPSNGPAPQQHRLPAGTWAADVTTGDVFGGDAVRLTPSHNPSQVFRSAPGTPDVAHAYRGSFLDHRQLPSTLQQGANSCFYGWPTPPVENSHLMSWCVDHTSGQAENYPLSVHLAAQLDGASGRTPFGRGPSSRHQGGSYLGLYAPSPVPPAQMGIHGVGDQGHYYQPDLQMDGGIAAEAIASIAQEQLVHDRYQQQERTKLHLATGRQQVTQTPDALQSQRATAGYQPPSGLERHSTPPRPKLTTTFWEEERTTCYQVDAHGVCVARRKDNNMVNGTKLLNVAGLSRGKRDALLKGEKERHVVRSGPMPLKGVWIPFERAMALSAQFGIDSNMHPLFEGELDRYLLFGEPREQGGDGPLPLSVLSRPSPSAVTSETITAAGADPPASASVGVVPSSYSVPEEYRDFIIPS